MGGTKRQDFGYISQIIETELGEKLKGGGRYVTCQAADKKC
jgi:hypothetical protein